MSVVEKLQLDPKKYLDLSLNGKDYAIKKPSVSKMLQMEDECSSMDGGIDMAKYIGKIVELLAPRVTIDSICPIENSFELNGDNGFTIEIKDMTAKSMLEIVSKTMVLDKDNIIRTNQIGMLEEILKYSELKEVDDLPTYKDAKLIVQDFSGRVDIQPLIELYEFFRKEFQA